jgi:hypothetical protein
VWSLPHYASPFTPVLWVLLLQALRYVRLWRRHQRREGVAIARAVVLTCVLMTAVPVISVALGIEQTPSLSAWWSIDLPWDRERVTRELLSTPGRHLVIVRYAPGHHIHHEWVYNSAEIDGQPIVWARELEDRNNRPLLEYFRGRRAWLLEVTGADATLSPYPR